MNVSCVIIDDESNVRELIKNIIEDNFSNIDIVGTGKSVLTGLREINEKKPQLIFLDIELPDGTGFDILESIQETNFKVIFISAFNEYAIKAFKYSAVDYILKPVNIIEFIKSVNKAINSIEKHDNYNILLENIRSDFPSKLALQVKEGIEYVDVNDIICIKGEGRYSNIHVYNGKKYIESQVLSYFEEILNKRIFFRIHKSYLINLYHVKSYKKTEGGQIKMSDDSIINVSRSKKDDFFEKMADLQ